MLPVSAEFNRDSSQQAFVAPQSSHVDGKLWIQDVASTSVYRVDLKTGMFENFAPFKNIKPDSPLAGRPGQMARMIAPSHSATTTSSSMPRTIAGRKFDSPMKLATKRLQGRS